MRLGNAAVDDCSSQGLPDFYFFSLSSLLLSPLLSFSRSAFLLCPARPVRAFLFIASRSTKKEGTRRRRCSGGGGGGGRRGSHRDSYLLLSLFPLFSSPSATNDRRCLLSPLSFFFCYYFPSSSTSSSFSLTHPLARLQLRRPFSPSNSSLFLLRMFRPSPPTYLQSAPCPPHPRLRPTLVLEFFLSALHPRSFVFSFFLSFFLRRSRCPWSVISRRGGDENARLGLRAVASSPLPLPPSSYSIRFRSFLTLFFFRPAPFLFLAYARCGRAIGKSIDCEQRAAERSHCRDIYRGICGVNGPLLIRAMIARSTGDTAIHVNARSNKHCKSHFKLKRERIILTRSNIRAVHFVRVISR